MKPYYEQDGITIYHGDCREVLPDVRADALITDPPYGVNLGDHLAAKDRRTDRVLVKDGYDSYDDSPENLVQIIVPAIETALLRVKRGLVFCAGTKIGLFPEPSAIGGVYLAAGCGRSRWGFTNLALCLLYGIAPALELGAKPTVLRCNDTAERNGHPCPKPLAWMLWSVSLASLPREMIIDPFMGSGTTLRAAKDLGRRAIGIEIEERYCEIAAERLSQQVLAL